jgi:hypothetical protein
MTVATAADIELGIRAQQIEKLEDAAIKARYPNAARDDLSNPPTGLFDLALDAQTVLAARKVLQGTERSRYAIEVEGLIWFDPRVYAGVRIVDSESLPPLDLICFVTRWQVDGNTERTSFELIG